MRFRRTCILIAGLAIITCHSAQAAEFSVGGPETADSVFFRSTAKLEFIEGKTANISGSIQCEPTDMTLPVSGVLRVDLRTLKTGIDLRDQHMRERHLDTDEFPFAYFAIDSISGLPESLANETEHAATVFGYFYIRGVKRSLQADVTVNFSGQPETQRIVATATFTIELEDYGIPHPKALFMKLAETIEIELRFVARRSTSVAPLQLPDWPQVD